MFSHFAPCSLHYLSVTNKVSPRKGHESPDTTKLEFLQRFYISFYSGPRHEALENSGTYYRFVNSHFDTDGQVFVDYYSSPNISNFIVATLDAILFFWLDTVNVVYEISMTRSVVVVAMIMSVHWRIQDFLKGGFEKK